MEEKKYSAGGVKFSFWFSEFKKTIELINKGCSFEEIKDKVLNDNIFMTPTQARAKQIYVTVSNRVKSLEPSFYTLFEESDLLTQKLINLIAIMKSDQLLGEFVYEVYREKLMINMDELSDSDIRIFFKDKQMQSEKVAGWTDYTLKRLGGYYKMVLTEAGVIESGENSTRKIVKPIIDMELENHLKDEQMAYYYDALTGGK